MRLPSLKIELCPINKSPLSDYVLQLGIQKIQTSWLTFSNDLQIYLSSEMKLLTGCVFKAQWQFFEAVHKC